MKPIHPAAALCAAIFLAHYIPEPLSGAVDLVAPGATWRYRKGTTAPPAAWNTLGFNDSEWLSGPAGIGYGDGDDVTVLGDMQGSYLTIYARRAFSLPDPGTVETLVLRMVYDDGFIVYLNGVEVVRRGLGADGSPVAFDTSAEEHEAQGFEDFDITTRISLLNTGSNVLAVEVHNRAFNNVDLSCHPALVANGPLPGDKLPPGFELEVIASGFQSPVSVAFPGDGRMFVVEKRGTIRVVKDGATLPEPFLDLEEEVNNAGDRGLLDLAFHPDFTENGHVFVLYVVDPVPGSPDDPADAVTFGRLTRYTAQGDTVDLASRRVLIGASAGEGFLHCHSSHAIGTVAFGPDGALFVGSGDGAHFDFTDGGQDVTGFDPDCERIFGAGRDTGALRSQGLDTIAGKVLRVDPETGNGLPDNPYFTGNGADVRSRVWASGLRNPFRFGVRPDSGPHGTLYIGDVGWETYEELNVAKGGENFGWPCYEGVPAQDAYQDHSMTGDECQALGGASVTRPLIAWHHSMEGLLGFRGNCASGVAFYEGGGYPASYEGVCFFADYGKNWIKAARVDADDRLVAIEDFGKDLNRPVDLEVEPGTGDLVYVSIESGEVRRIRYTPGNRPPAALGTAEPAAGLPPLEVSFSSAGSFDPDQDAITFEWDFGDGSAPSTASNPLHTYTERGTFTATLTVRDGRGGSATRSFEIETSNEPPRVAIESPAESLHFYGGEVIPLRAAVSDLEDGEDLDVRWQVDLRHEDHLHPEWFLSSDREASFKALSHGNDGESFSYEVRVAVTDKGGLSAEAARELLPGELIRGDGNTDGNVDLADAVTALFQLFGGRSARCALALDIDANGRLEVTDVIRLLQHLFISGPPPEPPYPGCGTAKNLSEIPCSLGCP